MFSDAAANPDMVKACTYMTWIIHNLERIGDRITNVSERIVYMITNSKPDLNS